jgi:hypothetical protein
VFERHVECIVVKPDVIEVRLLGTKAEPTTPGVLDRDQDGSDPEPITLALPWAAQIFSAVKGVLHTPEPSPSLNSALRDGLLTAIAKARGWIDATRRPRERHGRSENGF